MNIKCRCCNNKSLKEIGPLPEGVSFAGVSLNPPMSGGMLMHCDQCSMALRHPILEKNEYNSLYFKAPSSIWSSRKREYLKLLRPDQKIINKYLINKFAKNKSSTSILDIGCYTGSFLLSLPEYFSKFGIEASAEARKLAGSKNITIVGNDLYSINTALKFDVIVLMDVIEHIDNPGAYINQIKKLLNENGEIIVTTGNYDSATFKFYKNTFWYAKYLEHISFIGESWLNKFAMHNGYEILIFKEFRNFELFRVKIFAKRFINYFLMKFNVSIPSMSGSSIDHFMFSIKLK